MLLVLLLLFFDIISYFKKLLEKKLGEGCFFVGVSSNPRYKTAYRVKAVFHIGLHIRDLALLEQIQLFFGVGKISKLGAESVWLRFILTQHDRDSDLLKSFISTLNCGRYIAKSGYGEFIVEKFTDVSDKVIPIFEEFKLHGIKSNNYEDFKKVALLMKNKVHLTREGLDEIKKIKGGMNKNRVY